MIRDFEEFKNISDVIIANRMSKELADVEEKYIQEIYLGIIEKRELAFL